MIRPSETLLGTNLNSVWMEGTLVSDPEGSIDREGAPMCRFRIQEHRPTDPEPASVFTVEAMDAAFEGCRSRLGRGHQVRIIGRLKLDQQEVKIIGEMVEPMGILV